MCYLFWFVRPLILLFFGFVVVVLPVFVLKVKKKINGSFSGGQETKELQELHGANIHVSRKYKYTNCF